MADKWILQDRLNSLFGQSGVANFFNFIKQRMEGNRMSNTVNLADMSQGKFYQVAGFVHQSSDYAEKLYKMGFVEGTPLSLAPVRMSDPLIVQIRGSRVALRKKEAQEILVEEL